MVDGPVSPEFGLRERHVVRAPLFDRISEDGKTWYKAGYLEGDSDHIKYTMVTAPPRSEVADESTVGIDEGKANEQASAS